MINFDYSLCMYITHENICFYSSFKLKFISVKIKFCRKQLPQLKPMILFNIWDGTLLTNSIYVFNNIFNHIDVSSYSYFNVTHILNALVKRLN